MVALRPPSGHNRCLAGGDRSQAHGPGTRAVPHAMDTCEPGQALIGAASSNAVHVPWISWSGFPVHGSVFLCD